MFGGSRGVLCAIALIYVCAACSRTDGAKPAVPDASALPADALLANVTGKRGGGLVTAITSEPETFNPILVYDADGQALNQIMGAGLTRLNLRTQEPEPALASSWKSSPDQRTWTFMLRQGLKWSDGKPFTADDVLFTMQIVNDRKIPSGAQDVLTIHGKPIEWTRVNDFTVTARLPSTYAPLLRFLDGGTVPMLPKHKWDSAHRQGKFAQAMQVSMNPGEYVTMGGFTLKAYKPGEQITLARNPHYWKKDRNGNRLPYLEEIRFVISSGQDQVLLKMQNSEIDTYQSIRPQDVAKLKGQKHLEIFRLGPSYENEQFFFNQNGGTNPDSGKPYIDPQKRSWFTDVNFRKAVSYAMDRNAMVRNALFGMASAVYGAESPANRRWYCETAPQYPHDLTRAIAFLKQSGFVQKKDTDGKPRLFDRAGNRVRFSLHTAAGNTVRGTQCGMIVSDLAKLGIQVDFSAIDFGTLVEKVTSTFDYDAALLSLSHDDADPVSVMNMWLSSGTLHFWWPNQKNPATQWEQRIDELMNLQAATFDYKQRKMYYDEVQQILGEQQPIIFTVNPFVHAAAKPGLGNLQPSIARHRTLWNADELYWK